MINREDYMGARRYGISALVFNSTAYEWNIELNTRKEILPATMLLSIIYTHKALTDKKSRLYLLM